MMFRLYFKKDFNRIFEIKTKCYFASIGYVLVYPLFHLFFHILSDLPYLPFFHTHIYIYIYIYIIPGENPEGRSIQFECSMPTAIDV